MVSNRDRQRAAARARLERQMAERSEQLRRRRRLQTLLGAGAGSLVLILGVVWLVVAVASSDDSKKKTNAAADRACVWTPSASPGESPQAGLTDVGTPPTDVPRSGLQIMTIKTNYGVVKVEMDASKTPCTSASMAYLASKNFFNGTKCHRLVPDISALQCGDPTGTGTGGPTYRYADENLPTGKTPPYPEGVVAMANGGPSTNGSQFFFVYGPSQLQANYSLWGKVTEGLDILKKIGAGGDDGAFAAQAGGGHPKIEFILQSVTVEPAAGASAPASSGAPAPADASASAGSPSAPASPAASAS